MDLAERFWAKVDVRGVDECWEWTAGKFRSGYGSIGAGPRRAGCLRAHRVSYELHFGPIPDGLHVCHACDNPPCVNPSHLFLGTHAENQADKAAKARSTRKLAPEVVREIRDARARGELVRVLAERYGVSRGTVIRWT